MKPQNANELHPEIAVKIVHESTISAKFNHLTAFAKKPCCASIIIGHINKPESTSPLYCIVVSIGIAGTVRSILAIVKTNTNEKPTEDVDELLLKLIDAPNKKVRRRLEREAR